MKKLHELLGKELVKGDVGLEIECEGAGLKEVFNEYWRSEDDGSLRGRYPESRIEFVLQRPIAVEYVRKAMEDINDHLKNSKPVFSFRTSVHAHVNVLDLTDHQLLTFIYTYLILEEPLMNYCGKERKGNRFCLRYQDAEGMNRVLDKLFTKGAKELGNWAEEHIRYAAINLAAIRKYGSVEFRGMRGTLETDVIDIWCKALVSIRNYACHQKDCLDVHDTFIKLGAGEFLKHVLGDLSQFFTYKNYEKDVGSSFSQAINLPYQFHEAFVKEKPKKAKVEEAAPWENNLMERLNQAGVAADPRRRAVPVHMPEPAPVLEANEWMEQDEEI